MMDAYHVSATSYAVGKVVTLPGPSSFVSRLQRDPLFRAAEDLLERERPASAHSRLTSLFAYPTLGQCHAFWSGEQAPGRPYHGLSPQYYRIEIQSHTAVPTALISHVARLLDRDRPTLEAARAFWSEMDGWQCIEFMTDQFTIMQVESAPTFPLGNTHYSSLMADMALAKRRWPL